MNKAVHKIQRGEILRMLYRQYPAEAGDNLIFATFSDMTMPPIHSHIQYLCDKGYVSKRDIPEEDRGYCTATYLCKITSEGIDLLEGNADKDRGILIPPMG